MPSVTLAIDLDGRRFVVAGAGGGGIGTAVCRALVAAGARVVALDNDETRLAAAAAIGDAVTPLVCDVRDADALEQTLGATPLDGLVHVAGGLRLDQWAPTSAVPLTSFDDVLALNLRAALVTSQAAARRIIAQGTDGVIVHVASIAALGAMPFGAAYAVAKAGLLALTRTQAVEWGRRRIRVNAVAAGTIATPKNARESAGDAANDVIPLGRRGTPDDVAGAVAYLCSDLARFITGHTLVVDGGSSVRPSYLDDDDLPVFVTDSDLRARLVTRRTE
jgi:NAD(P)-dependent dehydrogenase (short-subunit alcohol dehydrogenase family)